MALRKYTPRKAVDAAIFAAQGLNDKRLAEALGITEPTMRAWSKRHPDFRYAVARGRKDSGPGTTFTDYVYGRLTPECRELWDEVNKWADAPDGLDRVNALFAGKPERIRQTLWLHAVIASGYNASEACRRIGVSKQTVENWGIADPRFIALIDEIRWHKENFVEGHLLRLVREGDTTATIFASKTLNKDRGYGEKLEVNHTGQINHLHAHVVAIDDLALKLETRVEVLAALRMHKATTAQNAEVLTLTA